MDSRTGIRYNETSEDCLFLNLWTPTVEPPPGEATPGLPILVWIYGGGFVGGDAGIELSNGSSLALHANALVASISFHSGPFGFMALEGLGDNATGNGNLGIIEQQEALRFLRRVGPSFGGDPDRITLFGQSSGGMSVAAHLLSPLSKGLFSAAVIESGPPTGVLGVDAYAANSLAQALALGNTTAECCGCPRGANRVACMRAVTTDTLMRCMPCWECDRTGLSLTVDGVVLPRSPLELLERGEINPIRGLIIGANRDEAFQAAKLPRSVTMEKVLREITSMLLPYLPPGDTRHAEQIATRALALYKVSANGSSSGTFRTPWEAFDAVATDFEVGCLTRETAGYAAAAGVASYLYLFTHPARVPILPEMPPGLSGHTAEIPFVFDTPQGVLNSAGGSAGYRFTPEEKALSREMQLRWGALAATGAPNLEGYLDWPLFNSTEGEMLSLDVTEFTRRGDIRMGKQRCDFFHEFRRNVTSHDPAR